MDEINVCVQLTTPWGESKGNQTELFIRYLKLASHAKSHLDYRNLSGGIKYK